MMDIFPMPLRARLKADLPKAMKARQSHTVTALRTVLAAIDNAEAVEVDTSRVPLVGRSNDVPRKVLTEEQIEAILQREIADLHATIVQYQQIGKVREAEQLRARLEVLVGYL